MHARYGKQTCFLFWPYMMSHYKVTLHNLHEKHMIQKELHIELAVSRKQYSQHPNHSALSGHIFVFLIFTFLYVANLMKSKPEIAWTNN